MTTTQTAAARVSGTIKALMDALSSAIEWIDAVPSDTPLPTMPGFDRDAVDSLLAAIQPDPEPQRGGSVMQRYAIAGADICEEHPDGKWVLYSDAKATVARLTAELEAARAEAAAAYERAAQVADACKKQNRPKISDYHKGLSSGGQAIAAAIRALTTEPGTTALAEIVKKAVDAETRACAEVVRERRQGWLRPYILAILARIDQRKETGE